jgi:D-sedoheptulose 7-phosphate isomerase
MALMQRIESEFKEHISVASDCINLSNNIDLAANICASSIKSGGRLFFCGNGGSGDSQHLAAELIGRLKKNRIPLAAISLTVDSSAITCIGNDFGFDNIFSRQLEGLGKKGDVLIAISTSGMSENVINAVNKANNLGIKTIGFLGKSGGKIISICDLVILVPSNETGRIQEMHILIGHILCGLIENILNIE